MTPDLLSWTFVLQVLNVLVIPVLYSVGKILISFHTRLVKVEARLKMLIEEVSHHEIDSE